MRQPYVKPKKANITHPVILFKLRKSYDKDMEAWQLYAATRGQWDINITKAKDYKYALACNGGLVVEVYQIESWHNSNDSMNERELEFRKHKKLYAGEGKIEFVGKLAPEEIRKRYKNTNVLEYWGKSTRNSFKYVG